MVISQQGGRRFSKGDQPPRRGNGERHDFRGRGNNENALYHVAVVAHNQ